MKSDEKTLAIHQPVPLAEMQTMAAAIANSKMFGITSIDQALSLMLICQAEGLHPALAVRRYHIIKNQPAMRADAMQGEFEQHGAILWHQRTDEECSATFFADKRKVDDKAVKRAKERYKKVKAAQDASELAEPNELTIIRTLTDAKEKQVALSWDSEHRGDGGKMGAWVMKKNWKQSPRQMLHARCLTEGVRAIAPSIVAGVYTEDEIADLPPVIEATLVPDNPAASAAAMVTAAVDNRSSAAEGEDLLFADEKKATVVGADITEENYSELECHIGTAQGELLGRKVGEMERPVLKWLSTHYGDGEGKRWGINPTEKDKRLKQAVEIALSKQAKAVSPAIPTKAARQKNESRPPAPTSEPATSTDDGAATAWRNVAVPFDCKIKGEKLGDLQQGVYRAIKLQVIDKWDWKKATQEEKDFIMPFEAGAKEMGWLMSDDELRTAIKDRASELILTPKQLDGYLQSASSGILAKDESIETISGKLLLYIYQNWATVKAMVEEDAKPKAEAKKKGKKK